MAAGARRADGACRIARRHPAQRSHKAACACTSRADTTRTAASTDWQLTGPVELDGIEGHARGEQRQRGRVPNARNVRLVGEAEPVSQGGDPAPYTHGRPLPATVAVSRARRLMAAILPLESLLGGDPFPGAATTSYERGRRGDHFV